MSNFTFIIKWVASKEEEHEKGYYEFKNIVNIQEIHVQKAISKIEEWAEKEDIKIVDIEQVETFTL